MDLYAPLSTEKKPLVSRDVGEISTNDALFQEQAATAVAAAASQSNLRLILIYLSIYHSISFPFALSLLTS
jgi:hypothetical protein